MRRIGILAIVICLVAAMPLAASNEIKQGNALCGQARELLNSYRSRADRDKALEKYGEALKIFEAANAYDKTAEALEGMGKAHSKWRDYRTAIEYYNKALKIYRQLGHKEDEARMLLWLAQAHKSIDRDNETIALDYYNQALLLQKELGDLSGQASTLSSIGHLHSKRGQFQTAVDFHEMARQLKQDSRDLKGLATSFSHIGLVYKSWAQYGKAIEHFHKSLDISRKLGDAKTEGVTLNNIGLAYDFWAQYGKAIEYYQESLEIHRKIGDVKGEEVALNNIGNAYGSLGQHDKAIEYYGKSLAISRKLGDEKGEGVTLNSMADVYKSWGRYDQAIEYYEKSREISKKLGDEKGEGVSLNNIAAVYQSMGQYSKALELYEKSLDVDRKLKNLKGESIVLSNMGLVYQSLSRHSRALECYEKSLEICRNIGDSKGEAVTINNMGLTFTSKGEYSKSLEYHQKAWEIQKSLGDKEGEAVALNNIGALYSLWGQYFRALECCERSLEILQKLGDVRGQGAVLSNIATLYGEVGQHFKALDYYDRSLQITRKIGAADWEIETLSGIGQLYESMGEYARAVEFYEKALELQKRIGVPPHGTEDRIANLYLTMGNVQKAEPIVSKGTYPTSRGRLALMKRDFHQARLEYESRLSHWIGNRFVPGLFVAHTGLGLANEGLKDYDKAAEHFMLAIEVTEEMRESLTEAQRANFYDVAVQSIPRLAPYEGLTRVLLKQGKPEEALKQAEATKARHFAEVLSRRAGKAALDVHQDLLRRDEDVNNRLAAHIKALHKAYEKRATEVVEVLEKQVKELRTERGIHVAHLRKTSPLFAATKYPQPMGLEQTQIREHEWVLEYEVTDTGIGLFLVKGRRIVRALFKPYPREELEALLREFRKPVEVLTGDNVKEKLRCFNFAAGRRLADLLLGDILSDLPAGVPLIVVADDCLGVLPFEMLVLTPGGKVATDKEIPYVVGTDFFGERNPICYSQSLTALALARIYGKSKLSEKTLLVVADPIFGPMDGRAQSVTKTINLAAADASLYRDLMSLIIEGKTGGIAFPRLEQTGELADSLKELYGEGSLVFRGADASKEALLAVIAPRLEQFEGIVFATHGYFGKDIAGITEPVLILTLVPPGTDGYLRMSEVMGLKMNADIVALTACQTGLGRRISGEGTMGMGRAFQYAGARSVLMSLWSVAESSSIKLVQDFFGHLKEGKGKFEALRLAREEIRRQGYDHPFFWAAFILVGEAD